MATFEVYTPVLTKRSSHMGELASFEFVFPDHQGPRVRRELVQALFSAAPDWLKAPHEIMLLNCVTGEELHADWNNCLGLLDRPLSEDELLFVYSGPPRSDSSVAVDEWKTRASYGISVAMRQMLALGMAQVETRIIQWLGVARTYGECVMAAGSELSIELDQFEDVSDLLQCALNPKLNAYWVAADEKVAGSTGEEWQRVAGVNGMVLLRRSRTLSYLFGGGM